MSQSRYPSAPPPQDGPPDRSPAAAAGRAAAPPVVRTAVRLMLLRCVFSLAGLIVLITTRSTFRHKYRDQHPNATSSEINSVLAVGAAFGVLILVFYVFLAFRVRAGANWARIVTWVLGGIGILGALLSLGQPDTAASRALGVIAGLIDVTVVVLLALRESNAFFARQRRGH